MAVFGPQESTTLISRKIWMLEKSWNFQISTLWVGNTDLKGSSSANRKETHGSYQQSMMLDQAQLPKNLAITNYWWRDMAKMFWKNRLWSAAEWIWLTFSSWISYSKIRLLQRFEWLYSEIVSSGNLVNSRW